MNILFVNYGGFDTNSMDHIAGFANQLCEWGHDCAVAVPGSLDGIQDLPLCRFRAATHNDAAHADGLFRNRRPADILHAWTTREPVRQCMLSVLRKQPAPAVLHLEDNEQHIASHMSGMAPEPLNQMSDLEMLNEPWGHDLLTKWTHPRRGNDFLQLCEGFTLITPALQELIPKDRIGQRIHPGVDFGLFHPQPADPALRAAHARRPSEKLIVYCGGVNRLNESEIRTLYEAVALLNEEGYPCQLLHTGPPATLATFHESLPRELKEHVQHLGWLHKRELPAIMALADVFVQPGCIGPYNTYRLPSKIPQFLAMGKPVVLPATNLAHELRDGHDALFLQEGSAAEIATRCRQILDDPSLATRLGENAAATARRLFNQETNTRTLLAFYEEILRKPNPRRHHLLDAPHSERTLALARLVEHLADVPALQEQGNHLLRTLMLMEQDAHALPMLAHSNAETQKRLSELQSALAHRDSVFRAMNTSFSWKVTRPLRWLHHRAWSLLGRHTLDPACPKTPHDPGAP